MSHDVEMQIARAEREYERVTSASFVAKARVQLLNADPSNPSLDLMRARNELQRLEQRRIKLRERLEALEDAADLP